MKRFTTKLLRLLKNNSVETIKYVFNNIDFTDLTNEQQLKKKYPLAADEIGIISCWGIGDTVMVAGLAHALIKNNIAAKVVLIVKPAHQFTAACFSSVSKVYVTDDQINLLNQTANKLNLPHQELKTGQYFYAHFQNWELAELIGYKHITILDCYRALFKLNKNINLEKPKTVTEVEYADAKILFEKYKLPEGKTILLAPDANSISNVDPVFWKQLAEKLIHNGFTLVLNSDFNLSEERAIYFNIPLKQIVPFSKLAGNVISIRNGLCDLLSIYDVKLVVVYPKIYWNGGPLIDGSGISSMWPSQNLTEIEIDFKDENTLLNDYQTETDHIIHAVLANSK